MKFGLIGKTLSHSFSQGYFTRKFERENLEAEYLNFEMDDISEFLNLLDDHPDLTGLNVTIPYKSSIMPLLDHISPVAAAIGAVNTIQIKNGETTGYNTDVLGFHSSLDEWLKSGLKGPALILGTGGAAKAVYYVLKDILNWDEVWFCSRSPKGEGVLTYAELPEIGLDKFNLIVNTSPLGMYPNQNSFPKIPYEQLKSNHHLFDLVYNPEETLFMKKGKIQECKVKNGLEMLHGQADAAWQIWTQ